MTAGMRWSEVSALEWEDIDEEEGVIRKRRGQVLGHVDLPKEDDEIEFPLHPEMLDVLRWHPSSVKTPSTSPLLGFPRSGTTPGQHALHPHRPPRDRP